MKNWLAWFRGVVCLLVWVSVLAWGPVALAQTITLSSAEKAWVQANPVLRLGVPQEYPPYYFAPPAPLRPHGFIIETIDLWAERLGMRVEVTRYDNNDEALRALQAGQIDMVQIGRASCRERV